MYRVQPIHL
ncbi:hypothetical protein YPPY103_1282, partial [Yersinia pestis PY-103]